MEEGQAEALFDPPRHPCTRGPLAATPQLTDALTDRLGVIAGTPRSGGAMIGCSFAARCAERGPDCEVQPAFVGRVACHRVTHA